MKQDIRDSVWQTLEEEKAAAFPFPPAGRIPNFRGAPRCVAHAEKLDVWQQARVLKVNPDAPQRPLREAALKAGKTLYMAVPRLTEEACFWRLDPAKLGDKIRTAATIKGAAELGEPVRPEDMAPIDLVLVGAVAVDRRGGRLGKGGGYSDLEFALARAHGLVREDTPVMTSVHPLQVWDEVPMEPHDVPLDIVLTPDGPEEIHRRLARPAGIDWSLLSSDALAAMPPVGAARGARKRDLGILDSVERLDELRKKRPKRQARDPGLDLDGVW